MAAKKDFTQAAAKGADAFFQNTPAQQAEPQKIAANGKYNFNLKMPLAWKDQIAEHAWRNRLTISDLMNEIIGAWLEEHAEELQK